MKHLICSVILIFLLLSPYPAHSGYIDDWVAQRTETSPGYFEGQKRGYFNGGGFSARLYTSNDYLLSVTPPKIKAGCGGIDVFMGGFSFLDANYLVSKAQNILTAAPFIALDLSLSVLCEQCIKAVKSAEAIANQLNSLQFDDCKASKVMVAKAFSPFTDNAQVRAEAESDFVMGTGISDLKQELNDIWTSNDNTPTVDDGDQIAACPAPIREIFGTPGKTVLQVISEKKGYPREYIDLARGFVGDIRIEAVGGHTKPVSLTPCEQNKPDSFENFFSGNVYLRPASGGNCVRASDTNVNLTEWIGTTMRGIARNMKLGIPHLPFEQNFIDTTPLPIFNALKVAIVSNQEGTVISMYSNLAARAYAFGMMSDLYNLVLQHIHTARSVLSRQGGETTTSCQMALLMPAVEGVEQLAQGLYGSIGNLQTAYAALAVEINTVSQIVHRMEQFDRIAASELSGAFSPSMARGILDR